jgi:hypothetical protein
MLLASQRFLPFVRMLVLVKAAMVKRKAKVEVNVGDIFQIPIDDARVGYGQVVLEPEKHVLFICLFAATTAPQALPIIADIVQSDILLAGNTFGALFRHGQWKIIGNIKSNLSAIALPVYKYGMGVTAVVETLDRSRRRRATPYEESTLPFRGYCAPIRFELALKSMAGIGEWIPSFDKLKYDVLKASSRVVP